MACFIEMENIFFSSGILTPCSSVMCFAKRARIVGRSTPIYRSLSRKETRKSKNIIFCTSGNSMLSVPAIYGITKFKSFFAMGKIIFNTEGT